MHLVTGLGSGAEKRSAAPVQGLAGWLLEAWRSMRTGERRRMPKKQMRVVETLAIGPKKQLVLVSVGGERFLVGTGPESVQTIVRVWPEAGAMTPGEGRLVAPKAFGDTC